MNKLITATAAVLFSFVQVQAYAGPEDRQERREERGRADERQDRRDCRQEEGLAGKDKRDCKQEEVRDGVRGRQDNGEDKSGKESS